MTNVQQLREKLEKGFYLDNLYEMARLCKSLALDTASPAPFFVMEQVFLGIARDWEDRPLPVEEAEQIEEKMLKPLEDIVDEIGTNASREEVFKLLNTVVSAYLISFM